MSASVTRAMLFSSAKAASPPLLLPNWESGITDGDVVGGGSQLRGLASPRYRLLGALEFELDLTML